MNHLLLKLNNLYNRLNKLVLLNLEGYNIYLLSLEDIVIDLLYLIMNENDIHKVEKKKISNYL